MGVPIAIKVERTDLKAENERLRRRYGECQNELTQTMCDYGGALDDIDKLRDENAKLRELIRTAWLAGDFRAFLGADEIKEQMRELGIEVEE